MIRTTLFALALVTLTACSTPISRDAPDAQAANAPVIANHPEMAGLVAQDLVNALSQIDAIEPGQTTLYSRRPVSVFGEKMIKSLQEAGYRLRLATSDQQPHLSHTIEPIAGASGYTVIVSAGVVKVKRRYELDPSGLAVLPASSIYVLGASGNEIQTNDAIFDQQQVDLLASKGAQAVREDFVEVATVNPVPLKQEVVKKPLLLSNVDTVKQHRPVQKYNMYETRQSNFEDLLGEFDTVRREIMVFPNDSLVMGTENKKLTYEIADQFRPQSDVISVIGCSHGNSAISDGNKKLANGRAERVLQEFTIAGIDPELVLHEACWANVHFDEMMPRRGVVVTHKRKL